MVGATISGNIANLFCRGARKGAPQMNRPSRWRAACAQCRSPAESHSRINCSGLPDRSSGLPAVSFPSSIETATIPVAVGRNSRRRSRASRRSVFPNHAICTLVRSEWPTRAACVNNPAVNVDFLIAQQTVLWPAPARVPIPGRAAGDPLPPCLPPAIPAI